MSKVMITRPRTSIPSISAGTPLPSTARPRRSVAPDRDVIRSMMAKNNALANENCSLRERLGRLQRENVSLKQELLQMKGNERDFIQEVSKILSNTSILQSLFAEANKNLSRFLHPVSEINPDQFPAAYTLTEQERRERRRESLDHRKEVFRERSDLSTILECSIRTSNGFRVRLSSSRVSDPQEFEVAGDGPENSFNPAPHDENESSPQCLALPSYVETKDKLALPSSSSAKTSVKENRDLSEEVISTSSMSVGKKSRPAAKSKNTTTAVKIVQQVSPKVLRTRTLTKYYQEWLDDDAKPIRNSSRAKKKPSDSSNDLPAVSQTKKHSRGKKKPDDSNSDLSDGFSAAGQTKSCPKRSVKQ